METIVFQASQQINEGVILAAFYRDEKTDTSHINVLNNILLGPATEMHRTALKCLHAMHGGDLLFYTSKQLPLPFTVNVVHTAEHPLTIYIYQNMWLDLGIRAITSVGILSNQNANKIKFFVIREK